MTRRCNCSFQSQWAYIREKGANDEEPVLIDINSFLCNTEVFGKFKDGKLELTCRNGHRLTKYDSVKRRPHFKHVNSDDVGGSPMTDWHAQWQSYFIDTEVDFKAKPKSHRNRRTDALINSNVFEFQHSSITQQEVTERCHDYGLYNKHVIWVVDGNSSVTITPLPIGTFLITFNSEHWKYESFMCHAIDFIFLSVDEYVYRIRPSDVKSHMIDVRNRITEQTFVESYYKNTYVWDDTPLAQCTLYYNQRGAGCGKTYEIARLPSVDKRFTNKTTFIYLTKMHSAKHVIYSEYKEQYATGKLGIEERSDIKKGKQYKITFSKDEQEKALIIGTIDSFMYALGNKESSSMSNPDYFTQLVQSIADGYKGYSKSGKASYASGTITLNKNCLIVIDEAQDLASNYTHAIAALMRGTYIDTYLIGDKLQSIWGSDNMYVYLENNSLPHTNTIVNMGENIVRRFHNTQFIGFVNSIVPFSHFNLPPITGICDGGCKYAHTDDLQPYHVFLQQPMYNNDKDNQKIYSLINLVIDYVDTEVNEHGYVPRNFMFIFPFMRKNTFAALLETRLQDYWMNKFQDTEYQQKVLKSDSYWINHIDAIKRGNFFHLSFMHMSDEDKPINLSESEQSTRLLSIHASKGQGCEVVFVLNLTEASLKTFNREKEDKLKYESLLHVAITRQKKTLYIGCVRNNDDICKRLLKLCPDIELTDTEIPLITKNSKIVEIDDYIKQNKWAEFSKQGYVDAYQEKQEENVQSETIDWGHHIIRYCGSKYNLIFNIFNDANENSDAFDSLRGMLYRITQSDVRILEYTYYYNMLRDIYNKKINGKCVQCIPVLSYNQMKIGSDYEKYTIFLVETINNIKVKIDAFLVQNKVPPLCPIETVVFIYILNVQECGIYNDVILIQQIYDILHHYSQTSCDHSHLKCRCKCVSIISKDTQTSISDDSRRIDESIARHFDMVSTMQQKYDSFIEYVRSTLKDDGKISHNVFYNLMFEGENKEFKVNKFGVHVAYTKHHVIALSIKPNVSALNINDIRTEAVTTAFLLSQDSRFRGKQVHHCIFTFSTEKPLWFSPQITPANITFLKESVKETLYIKYSKLNAKLIEIFDHIKLNRVKGSKSSFQTMAEKLHNSHKLPSYCFSFFAKYDQESKKAKRCMLKDGDVDTFNSYLSECLSNWMDLQEECDF